MELLFMGSHGVCPLFINKNSITPTTTPLDTNHGDANVPRHHFVNHCFTVQLNGSLFVNFLDILLPSIHYLLYAAYPLNVAAKLEPVSSDFGWEAGLHPEQVANLSQG